jgi:hypothetical protein
MSECCRNCRFARPRDGFLRCHRQAPQMLNGITSSTSPHAYWPIVERTDWCGEWQVQPPAAADLIELEARAKRLREDEDRVLTELLAIPGTPITDIAQACGWPRMRLARFWFANKGGS